jgi:hypothetical protein
MKPHHSTLGQPLQKRFPIYVGLGRFIADAHCGDVVCVRGGGVVPK